MFLIKSIIAFSVSFLILSFPVQDKPLFNHAYKVVSPITSNIFGIIKKKATEGYQESKDFTRLFFSNSEPQSDKVNKRSSSTHKKRNTTPAKADDNYTVEEREILKKILETSN